MPYSLARQRYANKCITGSSSTSNPDFRSRSSGSNTNTALCSIAVDRTCFRPAARPQSED